MTHDPGSDPAPGGRRQTLPDESGYFGAYGGQFLPPQLEAPFAEITKAYHEIENDAAFIAELRYIRKHFQGRPTPVYHARTLSPTTAAPRSTSSARTSTTPAPTS